MGRLERIRNQRAGIATEHHIRAQLAAWAARFLKVLSATDAVDSGCRRLVLFPTTGLERLGGRHRRIGRGGQPGFFQRGVLGCRVAGYLFRHELPGARPGIQSRAAAPVGALSAGGTCRRHGCGGGRRHWRDLQCGDRGLHRRPGDCVQRLGCERIGARRGADRHGGTVRGRDRGGFVVQFNRNPD